MTVLFTWLGDTDRKAYEDGNTHGGPIPSMVAEYGFEKVIVLTNWEETAGKRVDRTKDNSNKCIKWLREVNPNTVFELTFLDYRDSSVTDLNKIYPDCLNAIEEHKEKDEETLMDFAFNLSSGTWAMSVSWVLISKTSEHQGLCYASADKKGAYQVEIPFELKYDFLPDEVKAELTHQKKVNFEKVFVANKAFSSSDGFTSDAMKRLYEDALNAADHTMPVLITGEHGTEKAELARLIHDNSSSLGKGRFVSIYCGSDSTYEIDKKLIGYTNLDLLPDRDAVKVPESFAEKAKYGTLYIEDVDKLSSLSQSLLLELIEDAENQKLKDPSRHMSAPRIITSTRKNLFHLTESDNFSEQLFFELSTSIITIPSLSSRDEDVAQIANNMLEKINMLRSFDPSYQKKSFSPAATDFIQTRNWPGNLLELKATVRRAALRARREVISENDLFNAAFSLPEKELQEDTILNREIGPGFEIDKVLDEVRKHYVAKAHEKAGGNASNAYRLIGLKNYQTFLNWYAKFFKQQKNQVLIKPKNE